MTPAAADTPKTEGSEALPNGTALLGDQFTVDRPLSSGGFGLTYLARDNYLDRNVVIKECYPEVFCRRVGKDVLVRSQTHEEKYRAIIEMFMREARSIAKMRHPNIVGVHRIFEDNETAYMVLDLIKGRDLLSIINDDRETLTPDQIKEVLIKSLDAVNLVHQNDLLHRDISPDNILLDKWGSPVLIDFGAAREEASRETRAVSSMLVVKDGYSPQEFYFAGGKQGPSSDLYALGATFYHLISGEAPPNSQTRMAEFAGNNPDPCEPLVERFPDYDDTFLAAIDQTMKVLPKDRIQSASEWLDLINPREQSRVKALRMHSRDHLNQTLTRLVNETNEYVLNSQPRNPRPAAKAASDPAPKPEVTAPEWAKEFNQETSEAIEVEKRRIMEEAQPDPRLLAAAPPQKRRKGFLGIFRKHNRTH